MADETMRVVTDIWEIQKSTLLLHWGDTPQCIECKHYRMEKDIDLGFAYPWESCHRPLTKEEAAPNPNMLCEAQRHFEQYCGEVGRHFEAK